MLKEISQKPVYINSLNRPFVYTRRIPFSTIMCTKPDNTVGPVCEVFFVISFAAYLLL